jgi:hypothetical protein
MDDPTLPTLVRKRDGRMEPFDADRICRGLFAACESLGRRDAFLARELADGVLHFLSVDSEGSTPTTERIAEVVVQVLREFGQLEIAEAYTHHRDAPTLAQRKITLHRENDPFTRDLTAAQEAGLLQLPERATADKLTACILGSTGPLTGDLGVDLSNAITDVSDTVAIDGLEDLSNFTLDVLHPCTSIHLVVNLNTVKPPAWAEPLAVGPLFATSQIDVEQRRQRAETLLEELLRQANDRVRLDWHLSEEDFKDANRDRLLRILGRCSSLVFDRPGKAISLGAGLDRRQPAVLATIGLDLATMAQQPTMLTDFERYIQRLESLVRLGLSAAIQKRALVRPRVGLLAERAVVVFSLLHLDATVQLFTNWPIRTGGESIRCAKRIVDRVRDCVRRDEQRLNLSCRAEIEPMRWEGQASKAIRAVQGQRVEVVRGPDLLAQVEQIWRETQAGNVSIVET